MGTRLLWKGGLSLYSFYLTIRYTICVAVFALIAFAAALSQETKVPHAVGPMSTQEHLRDSAWWPTKTLPTQEGYVGSAACARCHADIAASQKTTQMARTLGSAVDSAVLKQHMQGEYRSGPYTYKLKQRERDIVMEVSDGAQSRQAVLRWAFGSGDVGQSYLWEQDGAFYESRFNFFSALHGFGATPGRLQGAPVSADMALGRRIEGFEAKTCFSCHTTTMSAASPLDTKTIVPGVSCEACHGPGADHVAAMQSQEGAAGTAGRDRHIMNPGRMAPAQVVDFCGACHSAPWDVRIMGAAGVQTVRFPAYRLEKSRCWGTNGDPRVTCIACHDPHEPLAREPAAYDGACLGCHLTKGHAQIDNIHPGAACPVATSKCVSCHMPKYELPEMHYKFTDHNIRIARNGAPFPD